MAVLMKITVSIVMLPRRPIVHLGMQLMRPCGIEAFFCEGRTLFTACNPRGREQVAKGHSVVVAAGKTTCISSRSNGMSS